VTSSNRRKAAIAAVLRAKGAASFYKAWTSLRSEMDDTCNEKEALLHAVEAVSATPPEAGN
jgi:hypothetical protein